MRKPACETIVSYGTRFVVCDIRACHLQEALPAPSVLSLAITACYTVFLCAITNRRRDIKPEGDSDDARLSPSVLENGRSEATEPIA